MTGIFKDLFGAPEAQRDPHHWAATFMAHRDIGLGAWAIIAMIFDVWSAVIVVSVAYLAIWEGAQILLASKGKRFKWNLVWDGLLDSVAVTSGCYAAACLVKGMWVDAISCWFAMLIVVCVGWVRRTGN